MRMLITEPDTVGTASRLCLRESAEPRRSLQRWGFRAKCWSGLPGRGAKVRVSTVALPGLQACVNGLRAIGVPAAFAPWVRCLAARTAARQLPRAFADVLNVVRAAGEMRWTR